MNRRVHAALRSELVVAVCWLAALALVVALLLPVRERLESATIALVLLASCTVAALGTLRLSIAASLTSALIFNVLFIEPFGSPRIDSDASLVAFVVFPLIAVSLGVVVHRLRTQMEVSERRAAEATLLRDLTVDLVRQGVWLQPPLSSALTELRRALGLRGAALVVAINGGERFRVTAGDAAASEAAADTRLAGAGAPDARGVRAAREASPSIEVWPVASSASTYGALAIECEDDAVDEASSRVTRLFANVVALACERASLAQQTIDRQSLEAADQVRTALVQSVTHDLRTPLTSIRALASTIPAIAPVSEEQAEVVAAIEEQSERLAVLVDQVLDLGRIESGQLRPRLATMAIDEVVHAAVEATRDVTGDGVAVLLAGELPAVAIDEPLLVQVVVNLIRNAVRHGAPPIEVRADVRRDRLELRVVDHGPGIAESERRRIFDPTHAMRQRSSDERSHGLGLVIAAGFVEAHAGHLRVEPTAGGGATFVVSLPVERSA